MATRRESTANEPRIAVEVCTEAYEPWVRLALSSPPWSEEKLQRALRLRQSAMHLGEVAEVLNCSVFEVQAELGIGRGRDVRAYRRIRGLDSGNSGRHSR